MQTVAEHLKTCDRDSVINGYIAKYAFTASLMGDAYRDITIGEYIDGLKEKLNQLIDRLANITPKPDEEETWILMSVHTSDLENDDIYTMLVKKSEVLDENLDFVTPYGYEFTPHEEIAAFFIADTYLTQYYLEDVLIDVLFEASFTGFKQEGLSEILNELDTAIEEIDKGTATLIPWEDVKKDLEADGFEFEKPDPRQKQAWKEYIMQCGQYNAACTKIEVETLRALLVSGS